MTPPSAKSHGDFSIALCDAAVARTNSQYARVSAASCSGVDTPASGVSIGPMAAVVPNEADPARGVGWASAADERTRKTAPAAAPKGRAARGAWTARGVVHRGSVCRRDEIIRSLKKEGASPEVKHGLVRPAHVVELNLNELTAQL